jgi:tRNA (Thr-GGU) A37 N-methylase
VLGNHIHEEWKPKELS